MKTACQKRGKSVSAFTLIEIIVVMAIIAVLATMTISGLGYYNTKAKTEKTRVLIASIERALEDYKGDHGDYPVSGGLGSTVPLFDALYGDGSNVYLDTLNPDLTGKALNVKASGGSYVIVDAWGKDMRYRHHPTNAMANPSNDFDIISLGPNGVGDFQSGAEWAKADDIKNW